MKSRAALAVDFIPVPNPDGRDDQPGALDLANDPEISQRAGGSSFGFEDDHGLVGARDDCFGDGD